MMKKKINIITLGCSKNVVDSEKLARQLLAHGYSVIYDSEVFTDIVIINTCGFINDAKEESIDTILSAIHAKNSGKVKKVYVIGCLSERYAADLRKEIPEVDTYFGKNGFTEILSELHLELRNELLNERLLSTPKHLAYLKIAEGCDRTCAFCAIPLITGSYRSASIENLVAEANSLGKNGAKELILIAQDLSYYGIDQTKKSQLDALLRELVKVQNIDWLRLQYIYPNNFPLEVLNLMAENEKLCHYLDIPFQHITDNMLMKMKRNFTQKETHSLIDKIKNKIPDIALRTTLMVGHPGETEKDFDELLQFVKDAQFDRLGVFTYSHEEKTYAEKHYKDDIPEKIKQERADEIMKVQESIMIKKQEKLIGTTQKVIIDREEDEGLFIGRSQYDSYEVDTEIIIESDNVKVGEFYTVKIEKLEQYDLKASLI
ncbi:MAG: 30S ribosomal protein S12 methylthiotransferase RimO [Bacteroidales bacterium]|nr:30S ribosomal protein S12 methylthiotransferase RimO [Bacteroidales bacterium]